MSRTCDLYGLNELLYGVEWKKDLQDAGDVITFHVCEERNSSVTPLELDVYEREFTSLLALSLSPTRERDRKKNNNIKLKGKAIG